MKKMLLYSVIVVFICACKTNQKETLRHFSGYWEIEEVHLKDGRKKTYSTNETIDYIEVNDRFTGYRKKVKPLFNGTYETSKAIEKFQLKIENDSINVYYETKYDRWKETILKVSNKQLKIINQNNTVYLYKRYIPINLD